jgi:hypothetical protein
MLARRPASAFRQMQDFNATAINVHVDYPPIGLFKYSFLCNYNKEMAPAGARKLPVFSVRRDL